MKKLIYLDNDGEDKTEKDFNYFVIPQLEAYGNIKVQIQEVRFISDL